MNYEFPQFDKNDKECFYFDKNTETNKPLLILVEIPKPLQTIEEFYNFLIKHQYINEIIKINKNKHKQDIQELEFREEIELIIKEIHKELNDIKKTYFYNNHESSDLTFLKTTFLNIPFDFRERYKPKYDEALKALQMTAKLSANYVVKNRIEINNFLYDIILNIPNIKKKLLGIVDKPKLSEEEKQEIQKQRSREQYLKKKELLGIPDKQKLNEKEINKKIIEYKNKKKLYNKTYKDKIKLELQIKDKILLTDEQKREHRRIANKIYRDKVKLELQNKIKEKNLLTDELRKNKSSVALCQAEELEANINPN